MTFRIVSKRAGTRGRAIEPVGPIRNSQTWTARISVRAELASISGQSGRAMRPELGWGKSLWSSGMSGSRETAGFSKSVPGRR